MPGQGCVQRQGGSCAVKECRNMPWNLHSHLLINRLSILLLARFSSPLMPRQPPTATRWLYQQEYIPS